MAYDYAGLIKAANQTYTDTLAGYKSTLQDMQTKQAQISEGYGALQTDVLGTIAGQNTQALADARTRYAQAQAKMQQGMINRGLSGSTVPVSLGRGLLNDLGAEERRINADYSGQVAGMKSQLGLAGLGYRGQALSDQGKINLAQSGFMGSYAQQQNQLGLGFAGIANQERGQDINAQIARENMAQQMKLAQMENTTRLQAAYAGAGGGGGGGGGGSRSTGGYGGRYPSSSSPTRTGNPWSTGYSGGAAGYTITQPLENYLYYPGGSEYQGGGDPYGVGGSSDADYYYGD